MKIITFGSKREDYNTAKQLRDGGVMITPPRERLIHKAIKNLSGYSSNQNVEKLMGIAQENQYGLRVNSALRKYMEQNSSLKGEIFENNCWDLELQNATEKAIKKLAKNRREKFIQKYNEIFIQPQNLTEIEKKIIKYRERIINSKPMQEAINDKSKSIETSKALKLLDYFVASSETPMKEKAYILLKLSYFMGDGYSIHPQLKDKKFKVFSEIINDLVIKVPNKNVLTTKDCSQEKHGSCAATSAARKAILYEDKVAYIDVLLSELDDKPYMEIYDVTRLLEYQKDAEKYKKLRAPKVKVEKAQINYDRAIYEGYRVIDASALNWMKIAGTVGDGTISLQDYIAFDARHNGLFFDSRILKINDKNYATQHSYLRALIKSLELIKSYNAIQRKQKINNSRSFENKFLNEKLFNLKKQKFVDEVKKIEPNITQIQINNILSKALDLSAVNVKNNDEVLLLQVNKLLKSQLKLSERQLSKTKTLLPVIKEYIKAEKANRSTSKSNSVNTAFIKNKKLFELGLAQREVLLSLLKVPYVDKNMYYDEYKLPNYHIQFKQYIEKLIKLAKTKPQSPIILQLQGKHNYDNKELQVFLENIYGDITENVFEEVDKHLKVYNLSYKKILVTGLQKKLSAHRNGNFDFMFAISDKTGVIPNDKKFDKFIVNIINNLKKAQNYKQVEEAIRPLGAQNPVETIHTALNLIVKDIDEQIKKYGYESLLSMINLEEEITSEGQLLNYLNTTNEEISKLLNLFSVAANILNFPDEEKLIIQESEKRAEVLTPSEIELLKNKFDKISLERKRISDLREKGVVVKFNENMLKFTKEENAILNKVEKALPQFIRVVKREYATVNKMMSEELNKLYSELGKRTGHFWVREEGESGLFDGESIRILEQMTGRPYHIENDFDEVIKHIQQGKGSGISSTNVSWEGIGGHAQYIADVDTIKTKSSKLGKTEEKTVMLHDNTWGHSELNSHWIDNNGVGKTDYNRHFGPQDGFVLTDALLSGTTDEHFKYDTSKDFISFYKKSIEGPNTEVGAKISVPIFWDACLPGIDSRMEVKLNKILGYLLNIGQSEASLNQFFNLISKPENKLNVEFLNTFDKLIETQQENTLKRIVDNDIPKITLAEYNKLPENDSLKVLIEKHILAKAFPELIIDDNINDDFAKLKTLKSIEEFKAKKLEEYKDYFRELAFKKKDTKGEAAVIASSVDEAKNVIEHIELEKNIKLDGIKKIIKPALETAYKKEHSFVLDNLLVNVAKEVEHQIKNTKDYKLLTKKDVNNILISILDSLEAGYLFDDINTYKDSADINKYIKFLDKKFKNTDNEDLCKTHRYLMRWNKEEFEELIKDMTLEDIGINFDTPENVIKLIQAGSELEQKILNKVVLEHYYEDLMKPARTSAQPIANTLYRNIYIDLSNLLDEKYINKYKNMFFKKYKVRPAIPSLEVKSKEEIGQILKKPIAGLQSNILNLKRMRKVSDCAFSLQQISYLIENDDVYSKKDEMEICLNSLLKNMHTDSACNNACAIVKTMLNRLNAEQYNQEHLKMDLSLLNIEMDKILKGVSPETMKAQFSKTNSIFRKNIDYIVNANVLPKYQSGVKRSLYKWAELASKNDFDSAKVREAFEEALLRLYTHHVLMNPAQLFSHTVKLSYQKPKDMDSEVYDAVMNTLKNYLVEALRKVNKVKLEYKLISLAKKGNASKIRDYLLNNVRMENNQNFLSSNGMALIRNSLQDSSNNNQTLLLFVEQTGLIDELLNSIYKEDMNLYKKATKTLAKEGVKIIHSRMYLRDFFAMYIAKNENIKSPTNQDLLDAFDKYFNELMKNEPNKKYKQYFEKYLNEFKEIIKNFEIPAGADLNSILANINESCLADFDGELIYIEKEFNGLLNQLCSDIDLLKSMKILDNGTDEGKMDAHIEKIYKNIDYIQVSGNYLANLRKLEENK